MNDITIRFLDTYDYLKRERKVHTPKGFASELNVSTSLITEICKKRTNAGITPIQNLLERFNEINAEWLLTGKGEMLKDGGGTRYPVTKRNLIPLYNDVATIGGINSMSATTDAVSHTIEYIDAGDWFPNATAAIRHYGDSMSEYPSGCILALKKVEDIRLLVWGRNYCIETTEYRITKRLNKSKKLDYLTGYSSNLQTYPDGCLIHEPIDIPTEAIRRIFQVLGCVTKEYSNSVVETI